MNTFDKKNVREIVCPICNSKNNKFYCSKNSYNLFECLNCDLVFVYPVPGNLGDIYGKEYFRNIKQKGNFGYVDYEQDKKSMRGVFELYLQKLEKITAERKIFDVGAATGYFLDIAKERGWQTSGSEISVYAAEVAKKKGHKIFTGSLKKMKTEEKYDSVTMWDVLEHLDNPKEYLRAVNRILKKGGVVAINTIDKHSLWAKLWGKNWHLIVPPEHLYYYSRKNLSMLLTDCGFGINEMEKIGKRFSLAYIFKILHNWHHLAIWYKLSCYFEKYFWRKFALPVNLRDNIFIIANKIKDVD
ncbi:MAG: class I SAM-dependent methyltransferase [Candidatus Nitrosotenuis sp.]